MYIAFRWLFGLTFIMWFISCGIDISTKSQKYGKISGVYCKVLRQNLSRSEKHSVKKDIFNKSITHYKKQHHYSTLNLALVCATGLFICLLRNKGKVFLHAMANIKCINTNCVCECTDLVHFKYFIIKSVEALSKHFINLWKMLGKKIKIFNSLDRNTKKYKFSQGMINRALLKKLKDTSKEKKRLSILLAASIFENRNIKSQRNLEITTKYRLAQYSEETKKKLEVLQSQRNHFQHLYIIAIQENMHLQARIKKLIELTEAAERNLITLVLVICMSRNQKLMAFCSHFVVRTKEKLLNTNMAAEIRQFMASTVPQFKTSQRPDTDSNTALSAETLFSKEQDSLKPLSLVVPYGRPGEHIWTVKDKDGFIQKLYEYDFTTDFDNGDTIGRIREYSVYRDKDFLVENMNSCTIHAGCGGVLKKNSKVMGSYGKIQSRRFVTESDAFQVFLRNSKDQNVPVTASSKFPITYRGDLKKNVLV